RVTREGVRTDSHDRVSRVSDTAWSRRLIRNVLHERRGALSKALDQELDRGWIETDAGSLRAQPGPTAGLLASARSCAARACSGRFVVAVAVHSVAHASPLPAVRPA